MTVNSTRAQPGVCARPPAPVGAGLSFSATVAVGSAADVFITAFAGNR